MSVNYNTFGDILEDVLFRAGENNRDSDFEESAKRYILRAYDSIVNGGTEFNFLLDIKWWWLRKEATLSINGQSDGKYNLAEDVNYLGDRMYVQDDDDTNSVTVLESVAYQDILSRRHQLQLADRLDEFPTQYALVAQEIDEDRNLIDIRPWVQFNSNGDDNIVDLTYSYITTVDTETWDENKEPIVPKRYRKNIADYALYFLYVDKNDNRADVALGLARNSLQTLKVEHNRQVNSLNDSNFLRVYDTGIFINPLGPYNGYGVRRFYH